MRRKHKIVSLLLLGLLFVRSGALEVKHAPTVEQCRADQLLWLAKLEGSTLRPEYETLTGWSHEMFECKSVDPENHVRYSNVISEANADEAMRLESFLVRHGLYDKFIEEDKAGKR